MSENEIFVDCGAFTGDTTESFIKNANSNYKKIICFEPDRVNFEILNDNLKKYSNVNSYYLGVYSQKKKFAFDSKQNAGSLLDENGSDFIETIKLDDFDICKDATFIKMDIEGAELEALKGAEKIILNNKPKLAICIYHSDQDIIDIIEYIHKLRPDYKLYVRHHSLYEAETVLYCI